MGEQSQFVVGQWVECVEPCDFGGIVLSVGFYRVKKAITDSPDIYVDGVQLSWNKRRFRPVEWQVGKTYKTTLEGVTATLQGHSDDFWYGYVDSPRKENYRQWNLLTGLMRGLERVDGPPHLTPYLADEPEPRKSIDDIMQSINDELSKPADPINPPRYQQHPSGVECIQVTEHMSFCVGNAVKYLWRAGLKGDAVEDLRKAAWYIGREIERMEKMKGGAT